MMRSANLTALVSGLAVIVLAVLLILDSGGQITLRFAYAGPLIVAAGGAILLASGIEARRRGRR